MKDGKSFTLAEHLPNENAVNVTESSDGFFIIESLKIKIISFFMHIIKVNFMNDG